MLNVRLCALKLEAYLEPIRTSMMELLCKNSSRHVAIIFLQKGSNLHGPKYAPGSLDAPLKYFYFAIFMP